MPKLSLPSFPEVELVLPPLSFLILRAHSLAEMYAVLTKIPPPLRHSPSEALLSMAENVLKYFRALSLTGSDYGAVIREAALGSIRGGTVYDAILLKAAAKANVERIYSLNLKHLQAIAPLSLASILAVP